MKLNHYCRSIFLALCGISTLTLGNSFSSLSTNFQSLASENIAQQLNCKNATTQLEMNQCADLRAKAADQKMNQVYQQVLATRQGVHAKRSPTAPKEKEALIASQEAWLKYRDASCKYSEIRVYGGSIAPTAYSGCLTRLTEQRTQELERYLHEGNL